MLTVRLWRVLGSEVLGSGFSATAGRERPVKSKKKLWSGAIVGSATVPTNFGGHGGPPYGPKHFI
jgi:hypothetical protein